MPCERKQDWLETVLFGVFFSTEAVSSPIDQGEGDFLDEKYGKLFFVLWTDLFRKETRGNCTF